VPRERRSALLWTLGLLAFGLVPFALLAGAGRTAGLTGATGIFPADQLQYLAWVRDLSSHLLARNLFDLAPSAHVFTDPVFGVSGGLVRLGVAPAWAYDVWLPVAALALVAGYRAYVHRLVAGNAARFAALALALFAASPFAPVLDASAGLSAAHHNALAMAVGDGTPALQLWGYFPIAIALGLGCVALLALARAASEERRTRSPRAVMAIAAATGALATWLHPWQGATLLLVALGLAALDRSRRVVTACGALAAAVCVPLAYYVALSHFDGDWSAARARNALVPSAWWAALAVLAPLGALALAGVRRPGSDPGERILLVWPAAALVLYALGPPYRLHALETMSLPLAILAVRGGARLGVRAPVGVVLVLLATEPGLIFAGSLLHKAIHEHPSAYAIPREDRRALEAVRDSKVAGGVLAGASLASAVPATTGRATWFGHPSWTPAFGARQVAADQFFGGRMPPEAARRFVRSVGARILVVPCGVSPALAVQLGPRLVATDLRFGCARVLRLRH
jgi:hypothetical protein